MTMNGILSGVGNFRTYKDYLVTIPANAWAAGTGGQDGYVNTVLQSTISPDITIDANTVFDVIPTNVTTGALGAFARINAAESVQVTEDNVTVGAIKFYALSNAPAADITVRIRIYWY